MISSNLKIAIVCALLAISSVAIAQAKLSKEEAAIEEARATLELREGQLRRSEVLYKQGVLSTADLGNALAEADQARAQLARAKAILDAANGKNEGTAAALERAVATAKANLKEKEADLRRAENAYRIGVFAKANVEKIRAEAEEARTQLAKAKAMLESAAKADNVEELLKEAETSLARLLSAGPTVSEAEITAARIKVSEARIAVELRTIVQLREKEADQARQKFAVRALSEKDLKKALDALETAKRRQAEWK